MRRSSFPRLVVLTSCLVAGATFFSSPADAQRKKAAPAAAAGAAPKKKKAPRAPVQEAPAEIAPAAPVAEEPLPAAAPAPPPPPVKKAPPPPVAAVEETTDLGPPPQRSIRKRPRSTRSGDVTTRSADVEEEEDARPVHRKKPARHVKRGDQDAEEEEDKAAASPDESAPDKADDVEPPKKEAEAEAEPEPESDTDTDTDTESRKRQRVKPFLVDITAALRGFQRHFSYVEDIYNELPNYDLGGAPAIALEVGVYPFKNAKGSLSAGFVGSFDYAVGVGTTYKVPTGGQEGTHGTTALGYALGIRGNYAFGATMGNVLSAGAEFGAQSFIVDHPAPVSGNANIPSVEYKFIRPNVNGRFPVIDKLAVLGSLGYLMVSSAGEIVSEDYFRGATSSASGIDLGLGVAYEIPMSPKGSIKFLELRPMLTFRRYTFKFSPADDAKFIATGATDDYIGLNLGVATRL